MNPALLAIHNHVATDPGIVGPNIPRLDAARNDFTGTLAAAHLEGDAAGIVNVPIAGVAGLPDSISEILLGISGSAEAVHTHEMTDIIGLPEALDDIQSQIISDVDTSPGTLVRRNDAGVITNDFIQVTEIQPTDGSDTVFMGGTLDMQGNHIINTNLPQEYEFNQSSPATEWIVDHGFGKYPSAVTVYNSAGQEVIGTVVNLSVDSTKIRFSAAFSGKAMLIG